MKKFKLALLASLISSPLAAENIDNEWEVGVFVDYIKSSTNKEGLNEWDNIDSGKGYGLDLQKVINEKWNARLELATTYYDIPNAHDIDFGVRFGVDAIYKVEDSGVYLFTGVKRFKNAQGYNALNVGAGYNYEINDRYTLYSEAAVYRDINNGYTDQGIKIGLKYTYGEVKKSPIKNNAVVAKNAASENMIIAGAAGGSNDADNDGVSDQNDRCDNTPANVQVDAQGCSLFSEKEIAVNMNVLFENNSSQLTPAVVNDIQHLADFMLEYQDTSVVIEGHSSAVGSAKYNLTLSQQRADAVKKILIEKFNISANRLSSIGFGETRLISKGNTAADHDANRRVVAKITAKVKKEMLKN